jgi:hypothetical protein
VLPPIVATNVGVVEDFIRFFKSFKLFNGESALTTATIGLAAIVRILSKSDS